MMNSLWRMAFGRNFGERRRPAISTTITTITLNRSRASIALTALAEWEQALGKEWTPDERRYFETAVTMLRGID